MGADRVTSVSEGGRYGLAHASRSFRILEVTHARHTPDCHPRRSGTRREELLMKEDELQRVWILRKLLHDMEDLSATEFLLDRLKGFKTNDEFFLAMKRK